MGPVGGWERVLGSELKSGWLTDYSAMNLDARHVRLTSRHLGWMCRSSEPPGVVSGDDLHAHEDEALVVWWATKTVAEI